MPDHHPPLSACEYEDTPSRSRLEDPSLVPSLGSQEVRDPGSDTTDPPTMSQQTPQTSFGDTNEEVDAIASFPDVNVTPMRTSSHSPESVELIRRSHSSGDASEINGHAVEPSSGTHDEMTAQEQEEETQNQSVTKRLNVLQSIGRLNFIVLLGGTLLTILSLGYLVFLWAGEGPVAGGEEASHLWRNIMLDGWATQSVTLTSLIMRAVSAAQAGICTSLTAAIILERQIPLSLAARFSITRAVSGEPRSLLQAMASSKLRRNFIRLEVFLLFILALTALLLQFSSTILISDFDTAPLVEYANRTMISLALSPESNEYIGSFLAVGELDSSMALFGELESTFDPSPNSQGVSSTGIKRRAFIPYQKQKRTVLQMYKGAAFTLHTDVSCVRPHISARLFVDEDWPSMEGSIDYNQTYAGVAPNSTGICYQSKESKIDYCLPESFRCTMPSPNDFETLPSWPTALFHLPIRVNNTISNHYVPAWDQQTDPLYFPSGSWPLLVFTTNLPRSFWRTLSEPFDMPDPIPYGEWSAYEVTPGVFLNISLCFSGLNTTLSDVTMKGKVSQSEPDIQWNSTAHSLNVNALQHLLGADPTRGNISERNVLSIVADIREPDLAAFDVNSSLARDVIMASQNLLGSGTAAIVVNTANNESIPVCAHCDVFGPGISSDIGTVFEQIVATTGRAAVAVDAYLMMLTRSWYYSLVPKFDVSGYVTSSFSTEVLLPVYWNGLTIVIVLAAINTVTVWVITVLYIRNSRHGMIGNFWQAASQLMSKNTVHVLEKGYNMKDEEIYKLLEPDDFLVRVTSSHDDDEERIRRI
ncbi:hypothetical protein F4777DRAFT_552066 [Nemania sp. FL0916]|nr:hypothetical protein F4777DRAFT_552066 [Nemania sp. FL0916]